MHSRQSRQWRMCLHDNMTFFSDTINKILTILLLKYLQKKILRKKLRLI